jgi:hypothetical protein
LRTDPLKDDDMNDATRTLADIRGTVEYRLGDGPLCSVPKGPVEVDASASDVTLSWGSGQTRQSAAIPASDFSRYVASKAIVID